MCSKGPRQIMLRVRSVISTCGRGASVEAQTRCLSSSTRASLTRQKKPTEESTVKRHKSTIPSLVPPITAKSLLSFGQPTRDSHPEFFERDSDEVSDEWIIISRFTSVACSSSLTAYVLSGAAWSYQRRISAASLETLYLNQTIVWPKIWRHKPLDYHTGIFEEVHVRKVLQQ